MESQTRSVQITEVDKEEGTFSGLFAPYNETIEYAGKKERYERGLFDGADLVELYYNHGKAARGGDMPIGEVVAYVETENGLGLEGRFYDTQRAQEAYALTKAGKLNSLSANFVPTQVRQDDDVTVWERAQLEEVSLVKRPAYPSAQISQVRSDSKRANNTEKEDSKESTKMTDEVTKYDDSEIRSRIDVVERELAVVRENGVADAAVTGQFRSFGSLVKGLYGSNHEAAANEIRAYTGGTFADNDGATRPGWINQALAVAQEARVITDLFRKVALPASGMSVDIPVVAFDTGGVSEVAEGADMPYGEVGSDIQTFPVKKFGGYTSLSAEEIERSQVGMLDLSLNALVQRYARATEAYVAGILAGATGTNSVTLSAETAAGWIDAVLEGSDEIVDNSINSSAEFLLVSRDVFRSIAGLTDSTGRPLFVINGDGVNSVGGINVRAVSGNIAGLPIVVSPRAAAGTAWLASSDALFVAEDPLKSLNDTNIINATKDFSVYGYLAAGVRNPKALTRVNLV